MAPNPDLPFRTRRCGPDTAALHTLPNEMLALIASYLDRPQQLVQLALTCRRLNAFAQLDGWKAFQKGRFGLPGLDSDARNAVHGLTTLYRNWDRKAFTARYLHPSTSVLSLNSGRAEKWTGPRGQTMGYQPSVDSHEEMNGAWADRREVLAWSAGTNVVMRVRATGSIRAEAEDTFESGPYSHRNVWYNYKIPQSIEGRDDITALKLWRPHQLRENAASQDVVFGTASGRLSILSARLDELQATEQRYDTEFRAVGSISLSSAANPLIAATLGDSSLALYSTEREEPVALINETPVKPLSQVRPIAPGMRVGRIWSCNFISDDTIAIGLGPSYEPIYIYDITSNGLSPEPLRKLNLNSRTRTTDSGTPRNTSVYPIIPMCASSQGGSGSNTFLSGGYDGIVRLHDIRSPNNYEALFWDVTNDSSIYSLACQGLERFIAGSSMHSLLKVFDLRFPGSHAYHDIPLPTPSKRPRQDFAYNAVVSSAKDTIAPISGGWNLFLNPRNPSGSRHPYRPGPRTEDSPVYSLSVPSSTSTHLYAGLEGAVQSLDFVRVLDPHPDPLIAHSTIHAAGFGSIDIKATYNAADDVLNLGMYEQGSEEGLGMQLLLQDEVAGALDGNEKRKVFARRKGLDERWKDPAEDADKWVRGQEPQGEVGGRDGGRGRGRGRRRGRGGGARRGGRGGE